MQIGKYFLLYLLSALVLSLSGCNSKPDTAQANKDARLQMLTEEIRALKLELAQIKTAVTEIHRNTVAPARAQANPPTPAVSAVSINEDSVLGDAGAQYAIVEFSDYECPFCKRHATQTFNKIKEKYIDTGKVKYVFRDYPLAFHGNAQAAAVAANCAGRQGKYWSMHSSLFAGQRQLSEELFLSSAKKLNMNIDNFKTCLKADSELQKVLADLHYAESVGIRGTPHFFIGKVKGNEIVDVLQISGARPFSDFSSVLDKLLGS